MKEGLRRVDLLCRAVVPNLFLLAYPQAEKKKAHVPPPTSVS